MSCASGMFCCMMNELTVGHDHVVGAVHDERGLLDRLEIVVGALFLDAPFVHRFNSAAGETGSFTSGSRLLLAKMLALQELLSCRLGRLRRTEQDREPKVLGRIIGGAEDPLCDLGQRRHALTAARSGAYKDQMANEIGRLQRDFLRDYAADREAEHIRLVQSQGADEGCSVVGHLLERGQDVAGAAGDAGVVEQDHRTIAGEAVRHRRITVIHGAQIVHVEDERHASGLAEAAIRKADAVSRNELRGPDTLSLDLCITR